MPKLRETNHFKKIKEKLDKKTKLRIEKLIQKVLQNPSVGKPMQNVRKGTRELYLKPFRLSYAYHIQSDTIFLLDFYHKKKQ